MLRKLHLRDHQSADAISSTPKPTFKGWMNRTLEELQWCSIKRLARQGVLAGLIALTPISANAFGQTDEKSKAPEKAARNLQKLEVTSDSSVTSGGVVRAATSPQKEKPTSGVYSSLSDETISTAEEPTVRAIEAAVPAVVSAAEVTRLPVVEKESNVEPNRGRLIDPSRYRKQEQRATAIAAVPPSSAVLERLPQVVAPSSYTLSDIEHGERDAIRGRILAPNFSSASSSAGHTGRIQAELQESLYEVVTPHHYLSRNEQESAIMAEQARIRTADLIPLGKPLPSATISNVSDETVSHTQLVSTVNLQDEEVEEEEFGTVELMPLASQPLAKVNPQIDEDRPLDKAASRFGSYDDNADISYGMTRMKNVDGQEYMWNPSLVAWEAPGFYHRPLYFEQVNLERYGHHQPLIQPLLSGAAFFGTIPILPYKMGVNKPCEPIFTLGHYRPGSCNPHQINYLPFSWRGVYYQSAATIGLIYGIPTYQ